MSQSQGSHRAARGSRGTRAGTAVSEPGLRGDPYDRRGERPGGRGGEGYEGARASRGGAGQRVNHGAPANCSPPPPTASASTPTPSPPRPSPSTPAASPPSAPRTSSGPPPYGASPYGVPASPLPPRRTHRAEHTRRFAGRPLPETLRRLLPQALVVACLAGGTTAFVSHDKAVKLSVEGTSRTLHTFADDVGELLAEQGLRTGRHDLVAPSPGRRIANGDEIAVRYGRPLTLSIDGRNHRVWTTARTVDAALKQLGVRAEGADLSASRGSAIGRRGLALRVRTERTVTFLADGHRRTVRTTAPTVREALEHAGIHLGAMDSASVPLDSYPRDGQTITVLRITGRESEREERIGYATVRRPDPELAAGSEVVAQEGRAGVRRVTYRLRSVNGVPQKPKRIDAKVIRPPRSRIVKYGTKQQPGSVAGADGLNWGALAQCESGGRSGAVDPSGRYGGLYQLDSGTWHAVGGSGSPQNASPAEQTYRAKKLYVSRGASPWPACGRKLTQ
jgi:uncharacterized protein YabE (DUF348 family)